MASQLQPQAAQERTSCELGLKPAHGLVCPSGRPWGGAARRQALEAMRMARSRNPAERAAIVLRSAPSDGFSLRLK
jgi:hypothetical protein